MHKTETKIRYGLTDNNHFINDLNKKFLNLQ